MVRRFDEPIEVRVSEPSHGTPEAFVWRGKVYSVRAIDGHWQERRTWWREDHPDDSGTSGATGAPGTRTGDRRVWRVRAQAGRLGNPGIFDLGSDGPGAAAPWLLLTAHD